MALRNNPDPSLPAFIVFLLLAFSLMGVGVVLSLFAAMFWLKNAYWPNLTYAHVTCDWFKFCDGISTSFQGLNQLIDGANIVTLCFLSAALCLAIGSLLADRKGSS